MGKKTLTGWKMQERVDKQTFNYRKMSKKMTKNLPLFVTVVPFAVPAIQMFFRIFSVFPKLSSRRYEQNNVAYDGYTHRSIKIQSFRCFG